jgi:hypothetical protein
MTAEGTPPVFADMAALIQRLQETVKTCGTAPVTQELGAVDVAALSARTGFVADGRGQPELVLAQQMAVELGHPQRASQSFVLLTSTPGLVAPGRVTRVGPDLMALSGGSHGFGQVVLVQVAAGGEPDPFDLENAQYLTNRLPGYMVRSLPGRLWVRVGRPQLLAGLDFDTVGAALVATYGALAAVEAVEVLFVTSGDADVERLAPIATEAKILAGQHKKLTLSPDGEVECSDLDCDDCDEQETCDALRDVVVKRRRRRGS